MIRISLAKFSYYQFHRRNARVSIEKKVQAQKRRRKRQNENEKKSESVIKINVSGD